VVIVVTISAPSSTEVSKWFNTSGIVYDSATGYPIPGAIVDLYYNGYSLGSATTGVDGDYLATVKINEAGTFQLKAISLGVSSPTKTITITAPPPGPPTKKVIISDNFDDNILDTNLWETFIGKSEYPGTPKAVEMGGKITFYCPTRSLAGIHTVKPVDLSNGHVKAQLYSDGLVTCFISILPSTEPFQGASYNKGYDIGIWEEGGTKLFIYSGEDTVYRKRTLTANPETIEIVLDGDTIRFLEEGVAVYSETYKPPSKLCNVYLWGHHWYTSGSGTSWADDFEVYTLEEAVGIPTTLTISAPDEVGPREAFNIFGQLTRDDTGVAIPNMSISVSYNGVSLGSVLTDMQGVYTIPASIPDPGTYTLRADYEGTEGYAASRSVADTTVAASPLEAAVSIAGSVAVGLVLIMYSLR